MSACDKTDLWSCSTCGLSPTNCEDIRPVNFNIDDPHCWIPLGYLFVWEERRVK
jgi:hypothetical protein